MLSATRDAEHSSHHSRIAAPDGHGAKAGKVGFAHTQGTPTPARVRLLACPVPVHLPQRELLDTGKHCSFPERQWSQKGWVGQRAHGGPWYGTLSVGLALQAAPRPPDSASQFLGPEGHHQLFVSQTGQGEGTPWPGGSSLP